MANIYVSGDPTKSLVQYKDEATGWQLRDHSYYGLGCPNDYGSDGSSGSDIPCSTRIVKDGNNIDQKNGTYYHYQASTVGSGGELKPANSIAPDSFCPLGWQLPYGGTGGDYYDKSKSYKYLFEQYLHETISPSSTVNTLIHKSYPLSIILEGYYFWRTGRLYRQGGTGYYWTDVVASSASGAPFYAGPTTIIGFSSEMKSYGFAIRCANYFSIPSSTARWQEHLQI